jgi:hypothetical protein
MKPYALGSDEGEAIWMFDSLDTIKAGAEQTGGGFAVVEFLDFEGSSVPLHVNDRWDTGFYILDGAYTFAIADDTGGCAIRSMGLRAAENSARMAMRFSPRTTTQYDRARRL